MAFNQLFMAISAKDYDRIFGEKNEKEECSICHGTGRAEYYVSYGDRWNTEILWCRTCNGTGRVKA